MTSKFQNIMAVLQRKYNLSGFEYWLFSKTKRHWKVIFYKSRWLKCIQPFKGSMHGFKRALLLQSLDLNNTVFRSVPNCAPSHSHLNGLIFLLPLLCCWKRKLTFAAEETHLMMPAMHGGVLAAWLHSFFLAFDCSGLVITGTNATGRGKPHVL